MGRHTNSLHAAPRQPLGDATQRLNQPIAAQVCYSHHAGDTENSLAMKGHRALRGNSPPAISIDCTSSERGPCKASVGPVNPRIAAIVQSPQDGADPRRVSQFSSVSSSASTTRQLKTHIGPWQLGKTLGKGSSARVRLARHRVTHQLVAVKIVAKSTARLNQGASLANLDHFDTRKPGASTDAGIRRMPLAIEREVAILKLIRHPNIIELLDIWENRSEIYLVTEYVEKGDLFTFINWNGALHEEEAIFYFRQMMTALEYCHSFNICHRDLKPENILLKANGQVKIADFGLAALQQDRHHQLRTACGSPHYAAPELLRHQFYKGPAVDIWSMGVILFAMLAGHLPFDDENMEVMLAKAKRAEYQMPYYLSKEAKDLIRRILVEQPSHRITMKQMWRHALIKKYDYLDEWLQWDSPTRSVLRKVDTTAVPDEIDAQILRQLKALWHNYSEDALQQLLKQEKPNDQKMFYWLLWSHREEQLENYQNNVPISKSDFHHLKPPNWGKRISTCQFANPRHKGHARSVSRFTVISNVKDSDEVETVKSYDPYNASRVFQPSSSQITSAKIVIHRDTPDPPEASQPRLAVSRSYRSYHSVNGSLRQRQRPGSRRASMTGQRLSHPPSMSSIRSHQSNPRVRANNKAKRGVDFSSVRSKVQQHRRQRHASLIAPPSTTGSTAAGDDRDAASCAREGDGLAAARRVATAGSMMDVGDHTDDAFAWSEEIEQLHHRIARDCDEAFRTSFLTDAETAGRSRETSPFALSLEDLPLYKNSGARPWDSRPLPPVPSKTAAGSPMSIDHHGMAVGSVSPPSRSGRSQGQLLVTASERRVVSEPAYHPAGQKEVRPLSSIQETSPHNWMKRQDPASKYDTEESTIETPTRVKSKGLDFLTRVENTIRVVNSPSAVGAVMHDANIPAPLNVRKASRNAAASKKTGAESWAKDAPPHGSPSDFLQENAVQRAAATHGAEVMNSKKRVTSWFRRAHKENGSNSSFATGTDSTQIKSESDGVFSKRSASDSSHPSSLHQGEKKKGFGLSFWKRSIPKLYIEDAEHPGASGPRSDSLHPLQRIKGRPDHQRASKMSTTSSSMQSAWSGSDTSGAPARKIEVQQNWLARLFRVKPATRYLCFAMPKRRARQELAILLREWRKYGMRDVEVDKERNTMFAKVGARNYLNLKEVSFAVEIMTVIEHGKRNPLCIARFTQERGAASSFHRVVLAVQTVFKTRGLLVQDKRKVAMMIKTLNS
ncbi:hypothetical protein VTJ83DRAFT_1669 [Remersonia thermophila]|uniref:non-specific serine/threonine protein kinase n=1 Tax=Remersonia thermophila TaxID=72144 RepID=A0ABR4DGM2_9PEZI